LHLNVLLNALDFKSREFLDIWSDPDKFQTVVEAQFYAAVSTQFAPELGGDAFVHEFLDQWVPCSPSRALSMGYLTDNNGQLVASLKCVEAFLRRCPSLTITVIPKNGQFGNDASWQDVEEFLSEDKASVAPVFSELRGLRTEGRWILCHNGPTSEGLDPGSLSRELCFYLHKADVIFAEGRAYAQIRGWRKPTYLIFPVKGRVAEASHGVLGGRNVFAFVRIGRGVFHFSHLNQLPGRVVAAPEQPERLFHAYGQTTAEYVKAVLSGNYSILRDRIFGGKEDSLLRCLQEESLRTGCSLTQIVLGTVEAPGRERTKRLRAMGSVDVFAIGGGGGFNHVTLRALRQLGVSVVAGVTSTDDGGSTGQLQKMLYDTYGYVFGMGDGAAILEEQTDCDFKKRLLSFRCPKDICFLADVIVERVRSVTAGATAGTSAMAECPDFLAFVSQQLNLARTIDDAFLGKNGVPGFRLMGASIRNLNIVAALYMCGALRRGKGCRPVDFKVDEENAERAWLLLEETLGLRQKGRNVVRVVPVTYEEATLWATYDKPIPQSEIERLTIPAVALSRDRSKVFGQQYIDQIVPDGKIVDFGLMYSVTNRRGPKPRPSEAYLLAMRSARLIIVGAGSLFGSQLAQLAVPGVMDVLIQRRDIRRVLVVNHVCMNETCFYSLTDHIRAVERLANKVVCRGPRKSIGRPIRIGDIFSDIVVPRTVAREIDLAMAEAKQTTLGSTVSGSSYPSWRDPHEPEFVTPDGKPSGKHGGILRNRYVAYVLDHPDFRISQQITNWELRVLGFLEQPPKLYRSRCEAGRYRGAVYALPDDVEYLVQNGIPKRHIHEVESIAMNKKLLKVTGESQIEEFPGLISESLVGIFRILLEKGAT
jgi:2-phospho-L-lactate transferase/gluconeogenesis factor (CofD/UPF0052 family)